MMKLSTYCSIKHIKPNPVPLPLRIKKRNLRLACLFLKGFQILENLIILMNDPVTVAGFMKKSHQGSVIWTVEHIAVAVYRNVLLFHAWKQPVQLPVKILPVAFS